MLRDRYYVGWVTYKGMEYQGRHETYISADLFERVQRVLDAHQGSGVRQRKHHHYLKGLVWCGRCGKRLILQRAVGRHGGEYFYFLCMGRQEGSCDHPYTPIEEVEDAVARHYTTAVHLPDDFMAEVRVMVDEASKTDTGLSGELRDRHTKRLAQLDRREDYFLDLAAEEGWPKDKLREKVGGIRREREGIQRSLNDAQTQLDTGRDVIFTALRLLENPAEMYARGNETVRMILNKAFFTRLHVDGCKVTGHEMREPFGTLTGAYRRRQGRAYGRGVASPVPGLAEIGADSEGGSLLDMGGNTVLGLGEPSGCGTAANRPALPGENGAESDLSFTDLLNLALGARGCSKAVMVGPRLQHTNQAIHVPTCDFALPIIRDHRLMMAR
jgi:hypothetical protein